jgi:hypothetical protein
MMISNTRMSAISNFGNPKRECIGESWKKTANEQTDRLDKAASAAVVPSAAGCRCRTSRPRIPLSRAHQRRSGIKNEGAAPDPLAVTRTHQVINAVAAARRSDAGAAVKAATIIFAELTLAVAIVFIVLLLVRVYG